MRSEPSLIWSAAFNATGVVPWLNEKIIGPYRIVIRKGNEVVGEWQMNNDPPTRIRTVDKPVDTQHSALCMIEYWRDGE
jgi:hypothetical protein